MHDDDKKVLEALRKPWGPKEAARFADELDRVDRCLDPVRAVLEGKLPEAVLEDLLDALECFGATHPAMVERLQKLMPIQTKEAKSE